MANSTLPPGMDDAAFVLLPETTRRTWLQWVQDLRWLMEQPQFRRVVIRFIDDPQFCGASVDVFDPDALVMARKTGFVGAGRLLQLQLQHVAPRLWRRALNEESTARESAGTPEASNG